MKYRSWFGVGLQIGYSIGYVSLNINFATFGISRTIFLFHRNPLVYTTVVGGETQMVPAHTTLDSSNSSNETNISNSGKSRLVCMLSTILITPHSKMCTLFILTVTWLYQASHMLYEITKNCWSYQTRHQRYWLFCVSCKLTWWEFLLNQWIVI